MPAVRENTPTRSASLALATPLPNPWLGDAERRAAQEVAILVGGIFALLWLMPIVELAYAARYIGAVALLAFVGICLRRDGATLHEIGLAPDTFLPALRQLAAPTILAALVLLSLGWALDGLRFPDKSMRSWLFLPVWAFLQQFLLLGFCHRRLRRITGGGVPVVLASTLLFGIIHAPNGTLMFACSLGGLLWAAQFERLPNLYAIALSHAFLSTCLSHSLPKSILVSMRVGYRYLVH